MQPEKRTNTNIGVGTGVVLQLAGFFLAQRVVALGLGLILFGIPWFIWGCVNYAEGKGHSKWVGLVGLAGVIGLIVLIVLPDQGNRGSVDRPQPAKLLGLVLLVAGFGFVVLGVWLHKLGEDATLERMLGPWPAVCKLVGFGLVIGSLLLMLGNDRR